MSYLSRESAPLSEELWQQIDAAVVKTASKVLTGRRFIPLFGPLGVGADHIAIDDADGLEEIKKNGLLVTKGRRFVEIPTLYEDFTLLARDMESASRLGYPPDLSRAIAAAEACALKEDRLIFGGNAEFGFDGLLTVQGANEIEKTDWNSGENAFTNIAAAIAILAGKSIYGPYSLAVSPDLYLQMQRLQPGTGLLEIDRVEKLLAGKVYPTPVLDKGKAVLACADERNMDLVIGQDIATAYLEQKELNHSLRVLETVLLRIKRPQAIVTFE